jgi:PAS domain S-box-containing protein
MSGGEVLGAVEFFSDEIRPPDDDLLRLFGSIGAQIGQFMRRTYADAAVRESEARKTAIFESALDSIVTMDHRGRVVEFNPAAEKTFGYTRDEMIGAELAEMIIPPKLRDAHRKGLAHYLQTGEGPIIGRRFEITAMHADGSTFDAELAVNRVPVAGQPLFTGYLRDITDRRKAEKDRTDLLALEQEARADAERANRRLNQIQTILEAALAHLSLEDLLPEILQRIADILHTDIGTILLVNEEDANLRVRSSIGVDDQRAREAVIPVGEGIAGSVTLRREPMIVDLAEDATDKAELYEGMRSLLAVPLLIEGRSIGVLVVGAREGRRFSDEDARLLDFAADRIAIAIENASLYEREHRVAMMLQRALLPDRLPGRPGIDLAARYVPGSSGVMVGGDWYDVVVLDDKRLGIAIGDVVGRGARAAAIMGQLRHSLRAFALDGAHPAELLGKLNSALTDDVTSDMATIFYLEMNEETGDVVYASAGHPPPLLRRASGSVEMLEAPGGIPVGTWPDATYTEATTHLDAGDTLILYTDGLVEEREIPIDEGMIKLSEGAAAAPRSMDDYCDMLLRHMFGDEEPDDDIAILAVHRSTSRHATFSGSFASHPSAVGAMREKVQRWLESLGVHPHDTYDVTLAVTEAAANAIEHPQDSETHDFQVNGVMHGDRLELDVRDHGRWREAAPSDRGRGLLLMRGLMDQVEIERLAHGTRLQMRKRVRLGP